MIKDGYFSSGDKDCFKDIVDMLLYHDRFVVFEYIIIKYSKYLFRVKNLREEIKL